MKEYELYLVRFYRRPDGWRFNVLEVFCFDSGFNRSLLCVGWNRKFGFALEILA